MSDRVRNGLLCILSLLVGGALYVLFRENTILARQLEKLLPLASFRQQLPAGEFAVFRFYLPDFLWSFSMCCGLLAILGSDLVGVRWAAGSALVLGCLWELLQWAGILRGTGDLTDILMYLAGCTLSILCNYKKERRQ